MAAPRVFVSSTYYDLKPVRESIRNFIGSLGYEPIMHEKSEVTYTQDQSLEESCYRAVESADIVVCIIGNRFGTQSAESSLSITMKEVETAIKRKKKVYIFIAKEIYAENRTYEVNKDTGVFRSAYTTNLKIHEFISHLVANLRNHPIFPFDSIDDIISNLRSQFAGLFQSLLLQEASLTDAKTAYELQQSINHMQEVVNNFERQKEDFFGKFGSTILVNNAMLTKLKGYLGLEKSAFFADTREALFEILKLAGFEQCELPLNEEDCQFVRYIVRNGKDFRQYLTLCPGLFCEDGRLIPFYTQAKVGDNLKFKEVEVPSCSDEDIPF